MSLRKKKPGHRWVTGIPRAQFQKIARLCQSILNQDAKLQQGPLSPLNQLDRNAMTAAVGSAQAKLAQLS